MQSKTHSPYRTAVAALVTFVVLVWGGVGVKLVLLNRATREIAVAPKTTNRPALDRTAFTPVPVR